MSAARGELGTSYGSSLAFPPAWLTFFVYPFTSLFLVLSRGCLFSFLPPPRSAVQKYKEGSNSPAKKEDRPDAFSPPHLPGKRTIFFPLPALKKLLPSSTCTGKKSRERIPPQLFFPFSGGRTPPCFFFFFFFTCLDDFRSCVSFFLFLFRRPPFFLFFSRLRSGR